MAIRKSVRELVKAEKDEFADAVLALKAEASPIMPGINSYDKYVVWHQRSMAHGTPWASDARPTRRNSAHRGPAFLPWHRQFLGQFEKDLQRISGNPNLALPYWDWEIDRTFPDFLGGDGEPIVLANAEPLTYWLAVDEGPFRFNAVAPLSGWLVANATGTPIAPLQRSFGTGEVPLRDPITGDIMRTDPTDPTSEPVMIPVTLPTEKEVKDLLLITEYDADPWDEHPSQKNFRNVLEGWWRGPMLHNKVHVWVGGTMGPGTSPNDPIFFLHHCNVDRIWAQWQGQAPSGQYEPQTGGPDGHNLKDLMFPWDGVETPDKVTPEDMLLLGNVTYQTPPAPTQP